MRISKKVVSRWYENPAAIVLTDPQDLHGIERIAPAAQTTEHDQAQSSSTSAQLEGQEVLDVVENALALLDRAEDGAEIIIGKNHVGSLLRHVSA